MFGQTIIEVKMESLKAQEFHLWWNVVTLSCDRRKDESHAHDHHSPHQLFTILDISDFKTYLLIQNAVLY